MKSKPQVKAHRTMRLNKSLGLKGKLKYTLAKAQKYCDEHSPSELVKMIAFHPHLSFKELSILTGRTISVIQAFYFHTIESVVLGEPRIKKKLSLKQLISARKRLLN